jgi:hypothetical protein
VDRVEAAIKEGKTRVIDFDLRAYFDNVKHDILLTKVARRVSDGDVMHMLKLILKATGAKGVPQGGVISPLLSNVYLNEVDVMLEKAKEVTREDKQPRVEYARFADDLVVLVDGHPRHDRLYSLVVRRLREELARLEVEVNEEKSRTVDLKTGRELRLSRVRHPARAQPIRKAGHLDHAEDEEAHRAAGEPEGRLPLPPVPAGATGDHADQSEAPGVGQLLCPRERQSMLLLHPRLGREEGETTLGAELETHRLRLEEVE